MRDELIAIPVEEAKQELAAALDAFIEGAAHLRAAIRALDEEEVLAQQGARQIPPAR